MSAPLRTVAAFDFDGTLARGDSLVPFLWRASGRGRTARALAEEALPIARALAGFASRDEAKEALLVRLLAGEPVERLTEVAERYADHLVARRLRRSVLGRLEWHRDAGHPVVIVSSSPELYVAPVGRRLGVQAVLATRLEVDADGRLSGRLGGPSCRGAEKVSRLHEWLGGEAARVWAYGDSAGDEELLACAQVAVRVGHRPLPHPELPPG